MSPFENRKLSPLCLSSQSAWHGCLLCVPRWRRELHRDLSAHTWANKAQDLFEAPDERGDEAEGEEGPHPPQSRSQVSSMAASQSLRQGS